jgi:hypothetical protein
MIQKEESYLKLTIEQGRYLYITSVIITDAQI